MTGPQPPAEQIAYQDILEAYQAKVAELTHQLVLADCRIKNRDEQIESLLRTMDEPRKKMARELPDVPHD